MILKEKILFSKEECVYIINLSKELEKINPFGKNKNFNVNYDVWPVSRNEKTQWIFDKIQMYFTNETNIKIKKELDKIYIHKYIEGQMFEKHADTYYKTQIHNVGVCLNNDYDGGEFVLYNTEEHLKYFQEKLIYYVSNGGNIVTQYQTNAFYGVSKVKEIGPFPMGIGRGRVTDEFATMKILKPQHPLLNSPNKITSKDFEGWIQERGLYFADKWSDKYETIFAINDANETELEGSVLYAKYGKGNFVFTGLAFFRQLPAGVPGAYRLFANMISVGK